MATTVLFLCVCVGILLVPTELQMDAVEEVQVRFSCGHSGQLVIDTI